MDEKDGNDLRISKLAVREISHGVVDRISDDACLRIAMQEERRIQKKVQLASLVADRAGRKTVREEDLQVVENILNEQLPP